MSKQNPTPDQLQFVEEVAALLIPWGMPLTAARLYGCLLLQSQPLSLDQIAQFLQISKSSTSVAARLLEKYGMARRQGTPGSKRVLYSAPENYSGLLAEQGALLGSMGRLLDRRVGTAEDGLAQQRLAAMSQFYLAMQSAIASALEQLSANQPDERFSINGDS